MVPSVEKTSSPCSGTVLTEAASSCRTNVNAVPLGLKPLPELYRTLISRVSLRPSLYEGDNEVNEKDEEHNRALMLGCRQ